MAHPVLVGRTQAAKGAVTAYQGIGAPSVKYAQNPKAQT